MQTPPKTPNVIRNTTKSVNFEELEPNKRLLALAQESGGIKNVQVVVKELLSSNDGIVNYQSEKGHTALWEVARLGNGPLCNLLLKEKADPNIVAKTGSSALHEAVYFNNGNIVQQLLFAGANTEAVGGNGSTFMDETPLQLAQRRGFDDIAKKIAKHVSIDDRMDARQGEHGPIKMSAVSSDSPQVSPVDESWQDLTEIMCGLNLERYDEAARAYCKAEGAESLAEMVEAELVDKLAQYLQLNEEMGKAKAILVKKRILKKFDPVEAI